jgi:uncharacterized membrane protein
MEKRPTPKLPNASKPLNPFSITTHGVMLLFSRTQGVAMLFVVLCALSVAFNFVTPTPSNARDSSSSDAVKHILSLPPSSLIVGGLVIFVIALFILVVSTMLHGISSYTVVRLAKGNKASLPEAFNAVLGRFGRYFLLYLWMNVKIALWSLLFIVPGIIAFYRYSFAGPLFFDDEKHLEGEAALKESTRLTHGGLLTLFASQFLFNLVTLFYIDKLITPASLAVLYGEYTALDARNVSKPKAHILSWLALLLPFALLLALFILSFLFVLIVAVVGGHFAGR